MSRLGLRPLTIPDGVSVTVAGGALQAKGPKGALSVIIPTIIGVSVADGKVIIRPREEAGGKATEAAALWGTTWALVRNVLIGVSQGFEKQLELHGVGYRAELSGKVLRLFLGFTHPVKVEAPSDVTFRVEKNIITVHGPDKSLVGELAASIRRARPPEPYKGKGIRYVGEIVRRKAGKVAGAAAGGS
ncbi:MAG: large subunit ribosomal protein L6 [Parcubacteria group bacterium Gr01-1014_38]|nr:MAG: large subunit ribosomal protein L6 [Parcubacteria group bacterium Gr01-1014_38]